MTTPLPAHLSAEIRQRIALLRESWRADEVYAQTHPRPRNHPAGRGRPDLRRPGDSTPTFPGRDQAASTS